MGQSQFWTIVGLWLATLTIGLAAFYHFDTKVQSVESHISSINSQMGSVDSRVGSVERQVDSIGQRSDATESRIATQFSGLDSRINTQFENVNTRISELTGRIDEDLTQTTGLFNDIADVRSKAETANRTSQFLLNQITDLNKKIARWQERLLDQLSRDRGEMSNDDE